ncbi:Gag-Pol polyprotein [Gossypium australe]|uniref:Gag-Pol polyprotein n=1 Tax=Gossypium australe TaxID=47621 RepID=A0A5B6VCA4_9ROSI|nr:Gag-Pol polyprotein [Gossypium australe]
MNEWFAEFFRTNLVAQHPPPPPNPQPVPVAPHGVELGLKNLELMLTMISREKSFGLRTLSKYLINFLAQQKSWWNNLISVIPRERVTGDFFQDEFRKKYISQRFIDQKCKEFLELKQGHMIVTEYEREFVRLSKYARECVSTKAIMCKRFEDVLNEDIRLLVGILELKEFVVLVERAYKAEELSKEKRKAEFEARDSRKRPMNKSFQSLLKKSRICILVQMLQLGIPTEIVGSNIQVLRPTLRR